MWGRPVLASWQDGEGGGPDPGAAGRFRPEATVAPRTSRMVGSRRTSCTSGGAHAVMTIEVERFPMSHWLAGRSRRLRSCTRSDASSLPVALAEPSRNAPTSPSGFGPEELVREPFRVVRGDFVEKRPNPTGPDPGADPIRTLNGHRIKSHGDRTYVPSEAAVAYSTHALTWLPSVSRRLREAGFRLGADGSRS